MCLDSGVQGDVLRYGSVAALLLSPPTMTPDVALQGRFVALELRRALWCVLELHVGRDPDIAFPTEVEEGARLHSTPCTARGFDDVNVL